MWLSSFAAEENDSSPSPPKPVGIQAAEILFLKPKILARGQRTWKYWYRHIGWPLETWNAESPWLEVLLKTFSEI